MFRLSRLSTSLVVVAMTASPALAQQSLGDILENFRSSSMGPAADFIGAAAFFGGLIAVLMGILSSSKTAGTRMKAVLDRPWHSPGSSRARWRSPCPSSPE